MTTITKPAVRPECKPSHAERPGNGVPVCTNCPNNPISRRWLIVQPSGHTTGMWMTNGQAQTSMASLPEGWSMRPE